MTRSMVFPAACIAVLLVVGSGQAGRGPARESVRSDDGTGDEVRERTRARRTGVDPAIRIVASAGSGRAPEASFRCDGLDDQVEIQAAIDALPDRGGTVRLLPGAYRVRRPPGSDSAIRIARSDVILEFDPGARIELADGQFDGEGGQVIEIDGSVPIERIRIVGPGVVDGNRDGNPGLGVGDNACIRLRNKVDDVVIGDGLRIVSCRGDAIFAKGVFHGKGAERSSGLTVRDVAIRDSDEGILWTVWDRVHIRDFVIEDILEQDGIEPVDSEDWIVQGGFISRTNGSAIDVFAAPAEITGSSRRGVIRDVHISEILGGSQVINIGTGVANDVSDILVTGCTIRNTRGSQTGISVGVATTDGAEVRNVVIDGVIVEGIPGTAVYFGSACRDCRLTGSTISRSGRSAVRIEGQRSSVVDVKLYDNNRDAVPSLATLSIAAGASRTTLRDLEIYATGDEPSEGRSIRIDAGASHTVVGACHCYGQTYDAVLDLGDDTVFE